MVCSRRPLVRFFLICGSVLPIAAALAGLNRPVQEPPSSLPPPAAVEQNNIGVGHMNQYGYREAAEAFRAALAADPDFNLARINLGIALFYQQDLAGAENVLNEALDRDRDNPYIHYSLGLSLKTQGELDKAAEHFRQVIEIDPDDAESYYNLGVMYSRRHSLQDAEAAFRKALELEPGNTSVMYNLGTVLMKAGKMEEGREVMERFRPLQQQGRLRSDMGLGTQYGEMGRYALAMNLKPAFGKPGSPAAGGVPGAPFADVSETSGLSSLWIAESSSETLPISFPAGEWSPEFLKRRLLPGLGGSVALADLDSDGAVDAIVTRFNRRLEKWESLVLKNEGKGIFSNAGEGSGVRNSGGQVNAAIGDFDNDGLPDLYLVGPGGSTLYRNAGKGRFEDVTQRAGVADSGLPVSATFVDYDHDGDLDIYVCHYADVARIPSAGRVTFPDSFPTEPDRMFRNNGDGTFVDTASELGVGNAGRHSLEMVASDIDNDRDIDLVVLSADAPPQVFLNNRAEGFSSASSSALPGISEAFQSLAISDVNSDGAMDFFLASGDAGLNALLLNNGGGVLTAGPDAAPLRKSLAAAPRFGAGALDYDNDGDQDLYIIGAEAANSGALWRNLGNGRFAYAGQLGTAGGRGSAAADFDGDGRPDIFYVDSYGGPHLLRNETGSENRWIGIRLQGLRSNKLGIGAKVEIRSGYEYQKREVYGHSGYLSQPAQTLWFGLGSAGKADTVTILWPSGILQSEINVAAGQVVSVTELDRKGTSCPLLYTWNGKSYQFVTDFLGGCAIGYLESPGVYSVPDTDEYVRIEGRDLVPKDGDYLLKLANQLEEIIIFDKAQLLVVDHPAGTDVYPNERLMPAPPFPEYRLFTTRNAAPPAAACDDHGNDILPLISSKDRTCPTGFRSLPFKGYAETHAITLDLGDLAGAAKVLLVMDAWIDYADSSSNLAASHSGLGLVPPYLQVRDEKGEWRTVIPSMGFPAGLPKAMTVDLTGKFLSSDHHVRIVTNMRIYWDRILVDTSPQTPVKTTRLDPASAELHFLGYPAYYTPDGKLPWIYDYSRIQPTEFWQTHAGAYTRYGDVRELLLASDDMYVITRNGDEISLRFDAAGVPPLPEGWVRDYMLYADGFGKDMDLNSLYPETMGPLPFHAMSRFPYPEGESYPDDAAHRRYRREYNTRIYGIPAGGAAVASKASRH